MERRSRLALSLSGGGFTGYLFEIGALTALDDLFDDGFSVNDFDFYVGVSAGSAAAALMANGVRPAEILVANLTNERPYYFERRDIFVPAVGEGFKSMARAVQQLSPVFKLYLRHRREMGLMDLLERAQESLPAGIYTLDPFARYLEATFAAKGLSDQFEALPRPLYIPAIDLDSGESVLFGDDGYRDVRISKAITASSAAPIYFCPVRIGTRQYIDAGIGRFACFELTIAKAVDFMLIIHPSSHVGGATTRRELPSPAAQAEHRGFLWIAEHASRINLEARLSLALEVYRREYPDRFFTISPSASEKLIFDRSFLSFRDRVHLLRCGYLAVVQSVQEEAGILSVLARHGVSVSLPRFEERLRARMQRFSAVSADNAESLAGAPSRARWSSAY
ncbi:patatin-like phospholipase family protein [Candidatus Nitrospira bockiana]